MRRLSKLLSRFGLAKVVYDDSFFADSWFREWESLKEVLAKLIESRPHWQRILDFGCGPGVMIDRMNTDGHCYIGCDYSKEARELYLQHYGMHPECYVESLDDLLDRESFDLFLSFDVFEHMTDEQIDSLLLRIGRIPNLMVNISRTRGIPGHINLKNDSAWIAFFEKRGYLFDAKETAALRQLYAFLRPGSSDQWDRNLFIFSSFQGGERV